MKRIDRSHLEMPYAGSRMLRDLLAQDGIEVGRKHVATLMKRMDIVALYRKPKTTKKHAQHRVYPYLLRGLAIVRPNQVYAMDITYIPMARGFVYLAAMLETGTHARFCSDECRSPWTCIFVLRRCRRRLPSSEYRRSLTRIRVLSLPHRRSLAYSRNTASASAWTAKDPRVTMFLLNDCGDL